MSAKGNSASGSSASPARARTRLSARILLVFQICFFFVAATPFELMAGSGYAVLIRFSAALILLLTLRSNLRLTPWVALIVALVIFYFSGNVSSPSQRLFQSSAMILVGALIGAAGTSRLSEGISPLIHWYLILHLVGFCVGFTAYYVSGVLLDLHSFIFPNPSRIEQWGSGARIAGFHLEPGSYAQWTMMAIFLNALTIRRILTPLHVFAALTVLASASLWGVLAAGVFLLVTPIESLLSRRTVRAFDLVASSVVAASAIYLGIFFLDARILEDIAQGLQMKASLTTQTGLDKVQGIEFLREELENILLIPGTFPPGFCPSCLSPNDIGVWANALYYFGVSSSLLLFGIVAWRLAVGWGPHFLPLLALALTWKAPFYDVFLWIIVSYCLHSPPKRADAKAAIHQ